MKKIIILIILLVLASFSVLANGDHNFEEAERLIDSGISCDDLTEEQLEEIGDYYMEQMHPGEAHEVMDERMGGEGSESLRLVHINMARRFYCGDTSVSMMGFGMMNGGMMGFGYDSYRNFKGGAPMVGYGMMGSTGMAGVWFFSIVYFALAAFVFSLIFWLTHNWLVKDKKRK